MKAHYGGRLKEMGKELHHIPPWESTEIPEDDGLVILMDRPDHRALNSTGSSDSARAWRQELGFMWEDGKHKEVIDTEIAEIQTRYGSKYDEALRQYLDAAERRGELP